MNETELSYIAGFFDADGSLHEYRYKATKSDKLYRRKVVKFYNTDLTVLEWLKSKIGGNIYEHNGNKIGASKQQCWVLTLTEGPSSKIIPLIYPYLRVKKQKVGQIFAGVV